MKGHVVGMETGPTKYRPTYMYSTLMADDLQMNLGFDIRIRELNTSTEDFKKSFELEHTHELCSLKLHVKQRTELGVFSRNRSI